MKRLVLLFILGLFLFCTSCSEDPIVDNPTEFKFTISYNGELRKFYLGETALYNVLQVGVVDSNISAPKDWVVELTEDKLSVKSPSSAEANYNDEISVEVTFENGDTKTIVILVELDTEFEVGVTKAWRDFATNSEDNVLLDFSFAGYKHGEVGPPDAYSLGYEIFNIVDYGADGSDELSDREAFIDAAAAAKRNGSGIIYFPEGRFILHDETDDENGRSRTLNIIMGNVILKGAGQDKSTIVMKTPNLPTNPDVIYSSPNMISIYHPSGDAVLTSVTGRAAKGAFSVEVASTSKIKAGDWVYLRLLNNNMELVEEELHPFPSHPTMTDLIGAGNGVNVIDYHQVVSVDGNILTFKEPIMRAVDPKWGWKVHSYPHYENVGIEDLTFEGNCKEDYQHVTSWQDEGAYKPVYLHRLTNSWLRRLTFLNVSEAVSIISCANVSAFDIQIKGRRGHSAIRSQGSSRVFIGKVVDNTGGRLHDGGYADDAGQFHACGVSKPSMGAVLWNLDWGTDSTFEAHSSQPRATLVDNCHGALLRSRAGGAESNLPNHLGDLTLWNLNSKKTNYEDDFYWWNLGSTWWKFLPPIIVGYHGAPVKFNQDQVILDESHGVKVQPESLYEAQLTKRLGYLPAWISELK